jgi:hypothetical protein
MTGPEHYKEAERLLATLPKSTAGGAYERALLDEAQVHATLALAAATIDAAYGDLAVTTAEAWSEARSDHA